MNRKLFVPSTNLSKTMADLLDLRFVRKVGATRGQIVGIKTAHAGTANGLGEVPLAGEELGENDWLRKTRLQLLLSFDPRLGRLIEGPLLSFRMQERGLKGVSIGLVGND